MVVARMYNIQTGSKIEFLVSIGATVHCAHKSLPDSMEYQYQSCHRSDLRPRHPEASSISRMIIQYLFVSGYCYLLNEVYVGGNNFMMDCYNRQLI